MCNEMDIFKEQYEQEMRLIRANGNNEDALRLRWRQYRTSELELLEYIKRKTLEQAGRKAALREMSDNIIG